MGKKGKSIDDSDDLPGSESLTWTDTLRGSLLPSIERVTDTGAVRRPKKEFLAERIKVRQQEAADEQKRQADEMRRKLREKGE
jgi:hypothetical protein